MNWKPERWDWFFIGCWLGLLAFCVGFWVMVGVTVSHHV